MSVNSRDYWEPGDMIFVTGGQRYGLTAGCRTVCLGSPETPQDKLGTSQDDPGLGVTPVSNTSSTPQQLSVTNICFCGNVIPGKRKDRRYCSVKCRQQACRGKQLLLIKR